MEAIDTLLARKLEALTQPLAVVLPDGTASARPRPR